MSSARFVGGDTMNFWIADYRDELLAAIRDWDFLLINDSEARMLAKENNLRRAAQKILDLGPNTLVIKRGEHGAMLFRRDTLFMVPGYLLEDVFDPDGSGRLLRGRILRISGRTRIRSAEWHISMFANCIARSFTVRSWEASAAKNFGVERFRTLTRKEIDQRFDEFRRFTAF